MSGTIQAVLFEHAAADASATRVGAAARPHPRPGQVAISVTYAGVNFKDVMSRRGDRAYVSAWPHVPGVEVAGTVVEIGDGVADLAVGQSVVALTNDGGLAEVAVASAALTVPVPDTLELDLAAAAPGALVTADLLLGFTHLDHGDSLLIHSAAGAVGHATAQLARHAGASLLVGTVGHGSRRQDALAHGYNEVVVRDAHLASELQRASECGFDVILDPQGTTMLDVDLSAAAPGARIIIFGNAPGTTLEPLPNLPSLFESNISIGAFSLNALSTTAPGRVRASIRRVLTLLAQQALSVPITYLSGLDAVPDAQQALAEGRGTGKYIVRLGDRT